MERKYGIVFSFINLLLLISFVGFSQTIELGKGENGHITVTTSDSGSDGNRTMTSQGFLPNLNASSRFLSQASYGPNFEEIDTLSTIGIESWIEGQFNTQREFLLMDSILGFNDIKNVAIGDPEGRPNNYFFDFAWWQYAMSSPDVLRQRVAFALSEFFVISRFSSFGDNTYALGTYYDMLLDNAFGNYRDLLEDVTYHAAMGSYLTYMNNPKSDLDESIFPDENYAREVMQLFSIGLCELNLDGTCQKDNLGVDIPTYDNDDIKEFAKIFTGFSYGDNMAFGYGPVDYELTFLQPMQIYNSQHEPGVKYLLNGTIVPDRNPVDGHADVADALDNLFNHPNVGPFLGKFLIQRLVTSNPSTGYVERVSKAFNGESEYGSTRGDMQAVLKAILLDEEARNCSMAENFNHGKLREPFIRYIQLARAFDLDSPSGQQRNALYQVYFEIQQKQFSSPSVFNFFQSDYQPIGMIEDAEKVAPEFQITNTQTITGYLNGLNRWLFHDLNDEWGMHGEEHWNSYDEQRSDLNLSDELELVSDVYLPQLLERLNLILAHGKLSENTIEAIIEALKEFDYIDTDCATVYAGDAEEIEDCENDKLFYNSIRAKMAILLVMSSPEYLINR